MIDPKTGNEVNSAKKRLELFENESESCFHGAVITKLPLKNRGWGGGLDVKARTFQSQLWSCFQHDSHVCGS